MTEEVPDSVVEARDTLFYAGLQNSSYKFARQKHFEDPENSDLMAIFGQTAYEYERTMNYTLRNHWCDRLDVLHDALEITNKCVKKDPNALQCERYFLLLAIKAADQQFFQKEFKALGIIHNWRRIHDRAVALLDKKFFPDVATQLGGLNSRLARRWYTPYGLLQRLVYRVPPEGELLQEAVDLHTKSMEHNPNNIENVTRLGQACLLKGEDAAARKWFSKVRSEMIQKSKNDLYWAAVANTALVGRFPAAGKGVKKSHTLNLPLN